PRVRERRRSKLVCGLQAAARSRRWCRPEAASHVWAEVGRYLVKIGCHRSFEVTPDLTLGPTLRDPDKHCHSLASATNHDLLPGFNAAQEPRQLRLCFLHGDLHQRSIPAWSTNLTWSFSTPHSTR